MAKPFSIPHRRFLLLLLIPFLAECVFLAFDVFDRKDWFLENILVAVTLIGLVATARKFPLSRISYTLIFAFLAVHEIGSHYTYAEVPYDRWFMALTGTSLNGLLGWERNNFDRIVHFLFGLLLAYPIREFYFRVAQAEGFWSYFLPLDVTMSTSMLYELVEWGVAEVVGGDLGMAYLGTQGDIWDAHKDMALASLGGLLAMLSILALNLYLQKDFAREWSESLRVKHPLPLGEDEIARLWQEKQRSDRPEPKDTAPHQDREGSHGR
jgi:putative membrane protein